MDNIFREYKNLNEAFFHKNFEIINLNNKELCFIFITGNTVNPEKIKDNKSYYIDHKNDFEWKNIAKNTKIQNKAGKIIFIKDVSSKFYKYGINHKISSIDQIINFLQKETLGYKVILCGFSAGAYLSIILSSKLNNIKRCYAFGPVFNLKTWKGADGKYSQKDCSYFTEENDYTKTKYFLLDPIILEIKLIFCVLVE